MTRTSANKTPESKLSLIQTLVNSKEPVDPDALLLINDCEVLTKDGIHGKISEVGVGFGTGRHTSKRMSAAPITLPPKLKTAEM
jgi:hypothetical protein